MTVDDHVAMSSDDDGPLVSRRRHDLVSGGKEVPGGGGIQLDAPGAVDVVLFHPGVK